MSELDMGLKTIPKPEGSPVSCCPGLLFISQLDVVRQQYTVCLISLNNKRRVLIVKQTALTKHVCKHYYLNNNVYTSVLNLGVNPLNI